MIQTLYHLLKLIETIDISFNQEKSIIINKCFQMNYNSYDWRYRCELFVKIVDISVKRGIEVYGLIREVSGTKVGKYSIPFSREVLGELSITEISERTVVEKIKEYYIEQFKENLFNIIS